jgi:gliding motility-associated-like protein
MSYYNSDFNDISVLYNQTGFIDCLNQDNNIDTIGINNNLEEQFYFVDEDFLSQIPDPNVLPSYHQDYINNIEGLNDVSIGGFSYGTYYVSVIDEYGCQFNQEIDISNESCSNELGSDQWFNCLFIPSVFTPNGDGINDTWKIYNIDLYEPNINVKIFNRWGQMVYDNKDDIYTEKPWDGLNFKGNEVEIATYYYVIEVDVDNAQKKYTGYVIVKR